MNNTAKNLDWYYNPMSDNYTIPVEEMTTELMTECTEFIKAHPFEEGGYLMMFCPQTVGYEESFWCVTSWTE